MVVAVFGVVPDADIMQVVPSTVHIPALEGPLLLYPYGFHSSPAAVLELSRPPLCGPLKPAMCVLFLRSRWPVLAKTFLPDGIFQLAKLPYISTTAQLLTRRTDCFGFPRTCFGLIIGLQDYGASAPHPDSIVLG